LLIDSVQVFGYGIKTHIDLTQIALEKSEIYRGDTLTQLGLPNVSIVSEKEYLNNRSVNAFKNSKSKIRTIYELLQDGVFSYLDAKSYLVSALFENRKDDRDKYFGLMFQTLGHIAHHLQDMGQPQHVRNDRHLPHENDFFEEYILDKYNRQSANENRSLDRLVAGNLYLNGASVKFPRIRDFWDWQSETSDGGADRVGMAEYTSTNFITDDTNFVGLILDPQSRDELPFPRVSEVSPPIDFNIAINDPGCDRSELDLNSFGVSDIFSVTGKMRWLSTEVIDGYLSVLDSGYQTTNDKASAFSAWKFDIDSAFAVEPSVVEGYSVNTCVFDKRVIYTIPRAVAFTTGALDFFFRGKLEIGVPENGVYSVTDLSYPHNAGIDGAVYDNLGNPFGYKSITLNLKNITKDIVHLDTNQSR